MLGFPLEFLDSAYPLLFCTIRDDGLNLFITPYLADNMSFGTKIWRMAKRGRSAALKLLKRLRYGWNS